MAIYKVKDPVSGLYWKGGGIRKNSGSNSYLKIVSEDGRWQFVRIDNSSEADALSVCFSKKGKAWTSLGAVKSALGYGHELGLNHLLLKCEMIKIEEHE